MARRDLSQRDFSDHATGELDSVIKRQSVSKQEAVPTVTAEEAMREARVLEHQSSRDATRVLFISRDTESLNPTAQSLDGYLNISEMFDEVHVLILRQGIQPRQPVLRPQPNVYVYTVATTYWWQLPMAAMKMVEQQLVFASGLRPDLVVARDPFESAYIAWRIARRYRRPTQLHILENTFYASLASILRHGLWRPALARFTIRQFASICGATDAITTRVKQLRPDAEIVKLPQLNPYDAVTRRRESINLQTTYPDFVFHIAYVGSLVDSTAALAAITAARYVMRNSKVSLLIIGDGKGKAECVGRAKALGLEQQVIFLTGNVDPIPYLKAVDLLLVTETTTAGDQVALMGAAASLPLVLAKTERREDWFTHLESAYLCAPDNPQAFSDGVVELVRNHELRQQVKEQATAMVKHLFHHDLQEYRQQYRTSIEAAMFVEDDE